MPFQRPRRWAATLAGPRTKLEKRAVELPAKPHSRRKISSVRIASPDQMCQSVCWYFTDHQLKAISPVRPQWNNRTGKSQTGCFGVVNAREP